MSSFDEALNKVMALPIEKARAFAKAYVEQTHDRRNVAVPTGPAELKEAINAEITGTPIESADEESDKLTIITPEDEGSESDPSEDIVGCDGGSGEDD